MKIIFFPFFAILTLLFSCSEIKKKKSKEKEIVHQEFIFNMIHFSTEDEKNMSFPNWFNENLIQQKNIQSISRKIYPSSQNNNPEELTPKETRDYFFDTDGSLTTVHLQQFYEYITIADIHFSYKTLKDEYGFSPVRLKFDKNESNEEALEQFFIYDKTEYQKNYLVYQEIKTGDYRFYMLKKEYWGTLSVDSIFNPNPQDLIFFGKPTAPRKSYYVENKVNESDIILYHYAKDGYPEEIKTEKFPFQYKRSFIYNEEGKCSGFIDSTFSNNEFLTRRNSSFIFKDDLPIEVIHESMSNNKLFIQIETFEYEFFK